ncbi:MAG: hypothetical protein AABY15_03130 [Nanoarchaeota archaeon]
MNKKFEEWLKDIKLDSTISNIFDNFPWSMRWGIYQKYFWETKGYWLSIYPYTDKFGGRIDRFWDERIFYSNFITNNPEEAQKKLVDKAFEMVNKKND